MLGRNHNVIVADREGILDRHLLLVLKLNLDAVVVKHDRIVLTNGPFLLFLDQKRYALELVMSLFASRGNPTRLLITVILGDDRELLLLFANDSIFSFLVTLLLLEHLLFHCGLTKQSIWAIQLKTPLNFLSLLFQFFFEVATATFELAGLQAIAENECKVDNQVQNDEENRHVANVEGDYRVIHPG